MLKRLFTVVCLLWILDPSASGQSLGRPVHVAFSDDVIPENVCAPDVGLYDETTIAGLDDSVLAKLRIELLERGFDPGFDLNAADADARLAEALRMFQAEFSLPLTGQADTATLSMLSLPTEKSGDSSIQRANPSR